jgi:hypothetical protein
MPGNFCQETQQPVALVDFLREAQQTAIKNM